jgi:hypothetical protein
MPRSICRDWLVVASTEQVSADLAGEAAILNLKSGVYYGLDPVGARIWRFIVEPRTIAEIEDVLLAEYEVEPLQCGPDVLTFIERLADEGLVKITELKAS